MSELHDLTLAEAGAAWRAGRVSAVELVEAHLARIAQLEPELHCFVTVTADLARQQARAADAERAAGRDRGPLHGLPVTLKDTIATAGVRTTAGSEVFADWIPEADAAVARTFRDAGAVLLGKASLSEMGYTGPFPTRNPWNRAARTGASSSGSAAGVAANLAMGSIGSDSAGSIRGPAAMNGVCGLKPTFGWIDRTGVVPLSPSFDTLGPITRTAEDCRLLLSQIVAPARRHALLKPAPRDMLKRLRLGVPEGFVAAVGGQDDIVAAWRNALEYFRGAGAELVALDFKFIAQARAVNWTILRFEAYQAHRDLLASCRQHYSAQLRRGLLGDSAVGPADYRRACQARTVVARELEDAFSRCDVIAMPAIPMGFGAAPWVQSPPAGTAPVARSSEAYQSPFNITGGPAISIPAGFNRERLPVGLQLGAARDDDLRLLHVAEAFAREAGFERHPPLYIGY